MGGDKFGNTGTDSEEVYYPFRDILRDSDDTAPAEPWRVTHGTTYRLDAEAEPRGEDYGCEAGDTLYFDLLPL